MGWLEGGGWRAGGGVGGGKKFYFGVAMMPIQWPTQWPISH